MAEADEQLTRAATDLAASRVTATTTAAVP
jgi:hypothetical protein